MEFVFRGKEKNYYDFYVEPKKDGSVTFCIKSKNATGESEFSLTAEEFDLMCEIRKSIIKDEVE